MQVARIFLFLSLGVLFLTPPGRACDPDHIEKITFTPGSTKGVNIAVGGMGTVDVAVTCILTGSDIQGGRFGFDSRLVEEDTAVDDELGSHTYDAPGPKTDVQRARAVYSFKTTLDCPNDTMHITGDESSGEGAPPCSTPPQLAVEIDEGSGDSDTNLGDGHATARWPGTTVTMGATVPACCVAPPSKTAFYLDEARESYRTGAGAMTVCASRAALGEEKFGGDEDCDDEDEDDDDAPRVTVRVVQARRSLDMLLRDLDNLTPREIKLAISDITGDLSHLPFTLIDQIEDLLLETDLDFDEIDDFIDDLIDDFEGNVGRLSMESAAQSTPVGTITLNGAGRWVDVTGPINIDGTFVATGTGTVAGFGNIAVRFTGRWVMGRLTGEYAVGVNGGLPGGQSINYIYDSEYPEWREFWEALGDLLIVAGQNAGGVNSGMIDGVDYSELSNAIAVQLMLAGHGLGAAIDDDDVPTIPSLPAQGAFAEISRLYGDWADAVAASSLPSRVATEATLRSLSARFDTLFTLRRRTNALRKAAPFYSDIRTTLTRSLNELSDAGREIEVLTDQALGGPYATVSAADFSERVAPDSIVSGFGVNLSNATVIATELPLPTVVDGVSVRVTDSAGESRLAGVFFGSAGQFNYHIPADTAPGRAVVTVFRDDVVLASGNVFISPVAPSLFTGNASGSGVPAALIQRVAADGTQTFEPVSEGAAGSLTPKPIAFAAGDRLFLLLYGTGIRGGQNVVVRINGADIPVLGFAAAPGFVGLDQVNAELLAALAGSGVVDVELIVDGEVANTVTLAFE